MKFMKHTMRTFALLFLLTAWSVCYAQFSGNVQGTVADKAGAVVVGATITLHNVDTGVDLTQVTNGTGFYRFTSIAPGNYEVKSAASGFKATSTTVLVTTGETRGIDISLVPGTRSDVTVETIATSLNPDETRVQLTLSADQIGAFPLPNRDVQLLIALAPGVTGHQDENPSSGYGNTIFSPSYNPPYHANGGSTAGNLFLIDDLPVNDAVNTGQALILPNAEMIAEVALQTQTYSVENGTSNSLQTAFTTKSGSNKFHGSLDYSYDGTNVGVATQPITNLKASFHQDLLLGSLGGPIYKDKTFFFGSFERQDAGIGANSIVHNVVTPDFAKWAMGNGGGIGFPNSPAAYSFFYAPPTRAIPTGKASDIALVSSLGAGIGANCGTTQQVSSTGTGTYHPTPVFYNIPCGLDAFQTNAIFNQAQPFKGTQYNVRLDHTLREGKDRAYVMYERVDQTLGNLSLRPTFDATTPSQNKYASVNYIHIFSPRLLNEIHGGLLRAFSQSTYDNPLANSTPIAPAGLDTSIPDCCFLQYYGQMAFAGGATKVHNYAVRDTVSYSIRNHNIRAGYQFLRQDYFESDAQEYSKPFSPFYNGFCGQVDIVAFLSDTQVGNPACGSGYGIYTIGGNGQFVPQYYGATSLYNGVFAEDSWRVRQNLTLTFGLRYDGFGNPVKYGSTTSTFSPIFLGPGSTLQQQVINAHTAIATKAFTNGQNPNFMPRAGFAFTPFKEKTTLIRGGVGFYETVLTPAAIANNLPTQPPTRISIYASATSFPETAGGLPYGDFKTTAPAYGYQFLVNGITTGGPDPYGNIYTDSSKTTVYGAGLNGYIQNLRPEKSVNYSLGLEQQFPRNFVLGITYVGSHSWDLIAGSSGDGAGGGTTSLGVNDDWNLVTGVAGGRPNVTANGPEWGNIQFGVNELTSNYNSMVVTARQNYKGLSYQASYNWSSALQDSPTGFDTATGHNYYLWTSPANPKSHYGPSNFDVKNAFSFGGGYEVPKYISNHLLDEATSHWRASSIIIAQTGTPFTVFNTSGTDYQMNNGPGADGGQTGVYGYPDYTGQVHGGFSRSKALSGVLNKSQFPDPVGAGKVPVVGNQGPNSFRNFGYFTVNAGLSKGFTIPAPHLTEGVRLYLRGEAVNLLNRTNWSGFDNDVNDGQFGTVLNAGQKRYIQIGGRLEF